MDHKPLKPEDVETLKAQMIQQAQEAWTMDELLDLQRLFKQPEWRPYVKYLDFFHQMLMKEIWDVRTSWERTLVLRGQMDFLTRIGKAPIEVERLIQSKQEEREQANG